MELLNSLPSKLIVDLSSIEKHYATKHSRELFPCLAILLDYAMVFQDDDETFYNCIYEELDSPVAESIMSHFGLDEIDELLPVHGELFNRIIEDCVQAIHAIRRLLSFYKIPSIHGASVYEWIDDDNGRVVLSLMDLKEINARL